MMLLFSYLNNIIHPYFVQFLTEPLIKVIKVIRGVGVWEGIFWGLW